MPRSNLEKWIDQPNIQDRLEGALVRVAIGQNARGEPAYRLARIRAVLDGEAAATEDAESAAASGLPPPAGPPVRNGTKLRPYKMAALAAGVAGGGRTTSKYLQLEIGQSSRVMPVTLASNKCFEARR